MCAADGVEWDVAVAIGGDKRKIRVTHLEAGSIIVKLKLSKGVCGASKLPREAAMQLMQQVNVPSSPLKTGVWTRKTISLQLIDDGQPEDSFSSKATRFDRAVVSTSSSMTSSISSVSTVQLQRGSAGDVGIKAKRQHLPDGRARWIIEYLLPNGPAEKMGKFSEGDVIQAINGVTGLPNSAEEIDSLLRGDPATIVRITIQRLAGSGAFAQSWSCQRGGTTPSGTSVRQSATLSKDHDAAGNLSPFGSSVGRIMILESSTLLEVQGTIGFSNAATLYPTDSPYTHMDVNHSSTNQSSADGGMSPKAVVCTMSPPLARTEHIAPDTQNSQRERERDTLLGNSVHDGVSREQLQAVNSLLWV